MGSAGETGIMLEKHMCEVNLVNLLKSVFQEK
jgi:hypothetical protein